MRALARRHPGRGLFALWMLLCLLAGAAHAAVAVPEFKARVTDLTGTLSSSEAAALEETLAAFEARKGAQLAVLIVPTTGDEAIEQYSLRVAEAWKLGRAKPDDGALLLIAKDDRKLRIEVGYGLEGVLNDATAKRIISEIIRPQFKAGDFAGGIRDGVAKMIEVIDGEPLPPPEPQSARSGNDKVPLIVGLVIGGFILGAIGSGITGRAVMPPGFSGLIAGGIGGLLVSSLPAVFFIALAVWVLTIVAKSGISFDGGHYSSRSGGGGFSIGGGGGGFSGGGGGSFGGGGASGDW